MLDRLCLSQISFINFSANSTEFSIFFLSYTELRLNFLLYSHGTECQKSHTLENPKIIWLWNATSGFRYVVFFFPLWRLIFKLFSMPIAKTRRGRRRKRRWCWRRKTRRRGRRGREESEEALGSHSAGGNLSQMSFINPPRPKSIYENAEADVDFITSELLSWLACTGVV